MNDANFQATAVVDSSCTRSAIIVRGTLKDRPLLVWIASAPHPNHQVLCGVFASKIHMYEKISMLILQLLTLTKTWYTPSLIEASLNKATSRGCYILTLAHSLFRTAARNQVQNI